MSRGSDRRQASRDRVAVLRTVQGHDNTVVHAYNHTQGNCPKCGQAQQVMRFCNPSGSAAQGVRGCELDGEHLHRICAVCQYPWVERCLDQAIMNDNNNTHVAESLLARAMAALLKHADGAKFSSASIEMMQGAKITWVHDPDTGEHTFSVEEPSDEGEIVHMPLPTNEEIAG